VFPALRNRCAKLSAFLQANLHSEKHPAFLARSQFALKQSPGIKYNQQHSNSELIQKGELYDGTDAPGHHPIACGLDGERPALEKLVPLVRAELHRLAKRYLKQERPGHLLQTTALVNEVYLRLIDWKSVSWQNRAHFFGVSARLMRRILVDFARSWPCWEEGREAQEVSLDEALVLSQDRSADIVALDDALSALAVFDPRKSQIVELRFFGGLSVGETAEVLKVAPITVMREWNKAKAWLCRELSGRKEHDSGTLAAN